MLHLINVLNVLNVLGDCQDPQDTSVPLYLCTSLEGGALQILRLLFSPHELILEHAIHVVTVKFARTRFEVGAFLK